MCEDTKVETPQGVAAQGTVSVPIDFVLKALTDRIEAVERRNAAQDRHLQLLMDANAALRNKTQAMAIVLGDLDDRPAGSLRERVTRLEALNNAIHKDDIRAAFEPPTMAKGSTQVAEEG